jgi:hypothetical protein
MSIPYSGGTFSYYPITGTSYNTNKPVNWASTPKNLAFAKVPYTPSNGAFEWSSENDASPYVETQRQAVLGGNDRLKKVMDAILYYGPPILETLVATGVIKNANRPGQIDNDAFDDLFQKTGGELSQQKIEEANRSANILGIPTSTWLLVITGILIYTNFIKPNSVKTK